jgi:MFS family permease
MGNTKKLHLISLISGMLFYTPVMTLLLLQRDISLSFLVASQTVFSIAMMASEIPTGMLADKFGQKISSRLGLLLDAIGMLQLIFVHNPGALLAFFAVRGISVAFRSGSDEALLYESYVAENKSPNGYSKAYGKFLSNDILGFILATALAGIAIQLFGTEAYIPMVVLTAIAVLVALAITFTLTTPEKRSGLKNVKQFNALSHLGDSLKVIKRTRVIFALTVAALLTLNGEYFLRQSYQPFFEQLSVPALFLGVALSIGKLFNFIVVRYAHVMEKYLTVDQIIFWVNALLGVLFVSFALFRTPVATVLIFILIQGLLNAERPVVSDYVNQRVESHQRSTVLSGISLLQNFGQVIARLGLAISIGIIGIGATYAVQGLYMIIGTMIGVWYLRRCGCTHKVRAKHDMDELAAIQELA